MSRTQSCSRLPLSRRRFLGVSSVATGALVMAGCGGSAELASRNPETASHDPVAVDYAPMFAAFEPADELDGDPASVVWPEFVLASPPEIQELYAFHVTSGGLMRYIPCFCGCTGSGHRNNRDCYVREVHADGSITFDAMAPT